MKKCLAILIALCIGLGACSKGVSDPYEYELPTTIAEFKDDKSLKEVMKMLPMEEKKLLGLYMVRKAVEGAKDPNKGVIPGTRVKDALAEQKKWNEENKDKMGKFKNLKGLKGFKGPKEKGFPGKGPGDTEPGQGPGK